jgi:hypothetical protein
MKEGSSSFLKKRSKKLLSFKGRIMRPMLFSFLSAGRLNMVFLVLFFKKELLLSALP